MVVCFRVRVGEDIQFKWILNTNVRFISGCFPSSSSILVVSSWSGSFKWPCLGVNAGNKIPFHFQITMIIGTVIGIFYYWSGDGYYRTSYFLLGFLFLPPVSHLIGSNLFVCRQMLITSLKCSEFNSSLVHNLLPTSLSSTLELEIKLNSLLADKMLLHLAGPHSNPPLFEVEYCPLLLAL